MRAQFRFVMHPEDEKHFADLVLADEAAFFAGLQRTDSLAPARQRALKGLGNPCFICPASETNASATATNSIQFVRSQLHDFFITEGTLSISSAADESSLVLERRFSALVRRLKKSYANSVLEWFNPSLPITPATKLCSANPSKPDTQAWVAPAALLWLREDSRRRVKQSVTSVVEARLTNAA